jgi:hypothetical protein
MKKKKIKNCKMHTNNKLIFAKILKKINTKSFLKKSCELKFRVKIKKTILKKIETNNIKIEIVKK